MTRHGDAFEDTVVGGETERAVAVPHPSMSRGRIEMDDGWKNLSFE